MSEHCPFYGYHFILFSSILESCPEITVFALDTQYRYVAFNRKHQDTILQLCGKPICIGTNMLDIITEEAERLRAKENFDRALRGEVFAVEETYGGEKFSHVFWQNYYSPIVSHDGSIEGMTCFVLNITARKEMEAQRQYYSYHDKLTGLYNRRYYEDVLAAINQEQNYPISIVMGDLNGLKLVNDAFGHFVGDELLKLAAQAITSVCTPEDIAARWGGDEFIILLPQTASAEAESFVARVKEQCAKLQIHSVNLDISFGWSTLQNTEQDIHATIIHAENLMYKHKMSESKSMRSQTIHTIMHTLHEKNPREEAHSKRVGELSQKTGICMGLAETDVKTLYLMGYLHDIGKIAIEEGILNKPGSLTAQERDAIRKHPEIGCRIIRSSYENSDFAETILAHHERWDGTGYPKGLKGDEIPLFSRIISIADSYDAMTSERPYKKAMTPQAALLELQNHAGKQFDPEVVDAFIQCVSQ
ncbi:MAG: HD domain-containing phosphohydrolase [Intestinibacillus sp.]